MRKDNLQMKYSEKALAKMIHDCRSNGFLLKCLMEWSPHKIIPYGIDNREEAIKKAREIFPDMKQNFEIIGGRK